MALTATACQKVVEDILSQLKMKAGNLEKFKLPCFRSNLYYDVRYRDVIDDPYQVQFEALKLVSTEVLSILFKQWNFEKNSIRKN